VRPIFIHLPLPSSFTFTFKQLPFRPYFLPSYLLYSLPVHLICTSYSYLHILEIQKNIYISPSFQQWKKSLHTFTYPRKDAMTFRREETDCNLHVSFDHTLLIRSSKFLTWYVPFPILASSSWTLCPRFTLTFYRPAQTSLNYLNGYICSYLSTYVLTTLLISFVPSLISLFTSLFLS
jgi:hypothetical protein